MFNNDLLTTIILTGSLDPVRQGFGLVHLVQSLFIAIDSLIRVNFFHKSNCESVNYA